MVISHRFFRRS